MANLPSRKDAEALFWRAMWFLLILGAASLVLNRFRLQPDTTSWSGFFLGIGVWAGALALCALLLRGISGAHDFLKAAVAMWRPLVLLGVAGYVLFFNDQGRELGISLMGEKNLWPIIFLFLALVYWAANTWHTARLGIHAALERGEFGVLPSQRSQLLIENPKRRFVKGDEAWLFWPPRLLGVCAHFFAAINLSLAAWGLPLAAWGEHYPNLLRCLAWTAPLAILLATALVWAEDVKRSSRANAYASPDKKILARRVGLAAIIGEILLLGGLAIAAIFLPDPQGFLFGTISIGLSAVAFLVFISWLRSSDAAQ